MKSKNTIVDSGKRHTLKRLIGTAGATTTIVSLPSLASLKSPKNTLYIGPSSGGQVDINATLISIPGTTNETLLLKNLTDKPLIVDRFQHAIVAFDGETIDCGAVCNNASITIPAKKDVMAHFSSFPVQGQPKAPSNSLNVQAVVSRLPEGTRVIPIQVTMQGTTAILLQV